MRRKRVQQILILERKNQRRILSKSQSSYEDLVQWMEEKRVVEGSVTT